VAVREEIKTSSVCKSILSWPRDSTFQDRLKPKTRTMTRTGTKGKLCPNNSRTPIKACQRSRHLILLIAHAIH